MNKLAQFQIDGKSYAVVEDEPAAVTPKVMYADDGFSEEVKAQGCAVRSKFIDEFLDDIINNSTDPVKVAVAEHMPRWYCILIPGRYIKHDPVFNLIWHNWNKSYSWSALRFGKFYDFDDKLIEGVTMVRRGFAMERMHLTLIEGFTLRYNSEVNEARNELAGTGLDIADLYRDR